MSSMASQITGGSIVYNRLFKENIKAPFGWLLQGESINRWPVDSPKKGPVTRKMFPCKDVIMIDATYIQRLI